MKSHLKLTLVVALMVVFTLVALGTASAEVNGAIINEFVASHTGADNHEYVEIFGDASTDHSTLTILQIEGDGSSAGIVLTAWPVGTTDAAGYWWTGYKDGELQNGTMTLKLVEDFIGELDQDLDTDNDGVLNITPWTSVVDDVAVHDGGSSDHAYSSVVLTVGYDGNSYAPGGASYIPDGEDGDPTADWIRNDFDLAGIPGFDGSPKYGEAFNTPEALNEAVPEPDEACGEEYIPIYEIQGDGEESPLEGDEVSTEGVVVAALQGSSKLNGFYIQDHEGDDNPATSDGILVYAPGSAPVAEGDAVRVRGFVDEYSNQTQIEDVALILDCSDVDGYEDWVVEPTDVTLPLADVGDFEMFEGMLVDITNDMFVTDVYNLVYRGEAILAADEINLSPTNVVVPGAPAAAYEDFNARRSIILDDGSNWTDPWYPDDPVPYSGPEGTLRLGDYTEGISAVLADNWYGYRLQPTNSYDITFTYIPRPMLPDDVGGTIKVATFNVLNFWTTWCGYPDCRGAEDADVFKIQSEKLAQAIVTLDADVIGLQELENFFVDEDAENDDEAIKALVMVLNEALGEDLWSYVPTPVNPRPYDNNNAIMNGIIFRNDRVTPVEGMSWWLDDPSFNGLVDGVSIGRAPIAQTFDARGELFTVITNHFKSKRCDDAEGLDQDQGDGQSCYNYTRTLEAKAVVDFVEVLKSEAYSNDDDVLVLGDFNSYMMEDPAQELDNAPSLINQLVAGIPDFRDRITYVYQGASGALDYIYTTSEMEFIPTALTETERITGVDIWHINHDEPYGFSYFRDPQLIKEPTQQLFRSSDHDPVLVGFCDAVPPVVEVTASPDWIWPPNHRYHEVVVTVSVKDNFDPDPIIWHEIEGWFMSNEPDNGTGDGNTTEDIILVNEEEGLFKVRAERAGHGSGRTYTFTYKATDSCGNVGEGSAIVFVPHDKGNKEEMADRSLHIDLPRP